MGPLKSVRDWCSACCLGFLAACVGLAAAPEPQQPPTLSEALLDKGSEVIDFLKTTYKPGKDGLNVGVLNFCVRIREDTYRNVGPLNRRLANRLETAVLLKLDPKEKDRIRLLQDVSTAVVKSKNHKADHRDPEGRRAFFEEKYEPSWGFNMDPVDADVFLTGEARILDTQEVEVIIQAFDHKGTSAPPLREVCRFKVPVDSITLSEAGLPFIVPASSTVNVAKNAVKPEVVKPERIPKVLEESPVEFEVHYGDSEKPEKLISVDRYREPPAGEKVWFRLTNKSASKDFGVVLRVNGENTLFRNLEEASDDRAPMWVVRHGKTIDIEGYQTSKAKMEPFKVAPPTESRDLEIRYGKHVGTFAFTVFGEDPRRPDPDDPVRASEKEKRTYLVSRGRAARAAKPIDLASLQAQLLTDPHIATTTSKLRSRGVIHPSKDMKDQPVDLVDFRRAVEPTCSFTFYYYLPTRTD
jgi:hypothetical protein